MGMDSSSAQHHHQEMNCSSQTLESMLVSTKPSQQQQQQENKKPRPADMDSLNCPRCDSTNTKFCYYNNYSLSQPRYFCKSCRRYWTKGGTLRNVPVGGGCRKNKRPSSSSSSCSSASSKQQRRQDHHPTMNIIPSLISGSNPLSSSYDSNDLTLAIARLQSQDYNDFSIWGNTNTPHHHHHHHHSDGFLETPPNGIDNFYYGNLGMENGGLGMGMGIGMSEEIGIPFEEFTTATATSTAVKQEICGGSGMREGESTKVLFGFPWQNGGGGGGNSNNNSMGEFDSGRSLSWNGISNGSSNWHGLLNSPLM